LRRCRGEKRGLKKKFVTLLMYVAVLLAIIVGYNYWSYSCGYCTRSSLMSFSEPALILIVINLLAVFSLVICKVRKRKLLRSQQCGCGGKLRNNWIYCPTCGEERKTQVNFQ